MLRAPFYDPLLSYEDNYTKGPFNGFADGIRVAEGEPRFDFLGIKINYPLGIPAGPLLNSKYVAAAFRKGFDVPVYKTARANEFPCHPFPNVLSVNIEGDLTLERAGQPLVADTEYSEPLSITNSFGVPSRPPNVWQEDAKKAVSAAGTGQVMVMSFMGTVREGQSADEFVADFAEAGRLSAQTGAKILEANLSCPNIGNEGLVCYNLDMTERVSEAIRKAIGTLPLILKVGYYNDDADVEELGRIATKYANAIASINTIAAPVVDKSGKQALPGLPMRLKSGVCGHAIKWAGLDMAKRLVGARRKLKADFSIVGVGGVTSPQDFKEYRNVGADIVMSATGAMWNPYLAKEIKEAFPDA
ncbi:MAG: dihydroorotate oxidase [Parcubacteria group bacterium Gr01-1014_8]|nr:MAG: dihydroorotate oxidase [Parcubacteria group bacterium Gr01-1014_8]